MLMSKIPKTYESPQRQSTSGLWSNYGPVIVSDCAKRDSGSHPCRVVSVSYEQNGCCHGRGRGFESRRPRHSFSKTCVNFGETIEDPKGHGFVPFLGSISFGQFRQ